jgi:predicted small integral membrane protein
MAEKKVKVSKLKGDSLGASGFTLGVLSIISLGVMGIVLSVAGFIFCLFQQLNKPTKISKAGLVLNIIGFVLSILWLLVFGPALAEWMQQNGISA